MKGRNLTAQDLNGALNLIIMNKRKSIFGLVIALGLLFSVQTVRQTSDAQIGSYLAREAGASIDVQRGTAAVYGFAGAAAGRYAGAKVGAAIGSAIAPGVGTVIGLFAGAL